MTNVQILTIVIALGTSFLAVLTGVLLNNTRLNDVKEVLRAEVARHTPRCAPTSANCGF